MIFKAGRKLQEDYNIGDEVWAIYVERCSGKSGRMHNKAPMFGKF